jgi:exonuclease III
VKLLSVKEGMYDFKSLDGNAYYASEYTDEGRVLTLEFDAFNLVLTYVPNSGQKLERLDYRLHDWDVDFRAYFNAPGQANRKARRCGRRLVSLFLFLFLFHNCMGNLID